MNSGLKINYQTVKSSEFVFSIIAYVSFGKNELRSIADKSDVVKDYLRKRMFGADDPEKKIKRVYTPARVSTGLTIPVAFWEDKKATGEYDYINNRLMDFSSHVTTLYNSMIKSKPTLSPKELAEQIKKHITSKFKQGEKMIHGKRPVENDTSKNKIVFPVVVLPSYFGNTEMASKLISLIISNTKLNILKTDHTMNIKLERAQLKFIKPS